MTPFAASILGYVLGAGTVLIIVAILLLVHGGRGVREEDQRRQERFSRQGRGL